MVKTILRWLPVPSISSIPGMAIISWLGAAQDRLSMHSRGEPAFCGFNVTAAIQAYCDREGGLYPAVELLQDDDNITPNSHINVIMIPH